MNKVLHRWSNTSLVVDSMPIMSETRQITVCQVRYVIGAKNLYVNILGEVVSVQRWTIFDPAQPLGL